MSASGSFEAGRDDRPALLTVVEAARELNIGRTLAYQLTARYLAGRPGGIPAIRIGGCVRVPRRALEEFELTGEAVPRQTLDAEIAALIDAAAAPRCTTPPDRSRVSTPQHADTPVLLAASQAEAAEVSAEVSQLSLEIEP
jgi:excisionase family DNA binding protein